jgi:hypothetical protein
MSVTSFQPLSTIPAEMNTDDLTKFNSRLVKLAWQKMKKQVKHWFSVHPLSKKKDAASYAKTFNTSFVENA